MTIALLGLGLMGRPMARTLLNAGWLVVGWNRSPLDPTLTAGIPLVSSLSEAAQAETIILMVSDAAAVDDVLTQIDPWLHAGHLVIDMGSSDPRHSQAHAAAFAARGIGWVDAPVSGGPEGAAHGTLAIMVGGTEADVSRAWPILNALGRPTHVGPPGTGHTAKVINQLIVGLTIQAVAEAMVLAERYGLDLAVLRAALAGGFADSKVLQLHGARMAARQYIPGGKVTTQLKDLRMAAAMAATAGVELPHLADTIRRYETLVALGYGDLDHSALHMLLVEGVK
ncbi:NAD(P)-dependent oxidoreductase [Chloroflexus sp.]